MKYYTDGYTIGANPSTQGGYTIMTEDEEVYTKKVNKAYFTNNEAELLGIYHVAQDCEPLSIISTDSMCMLHWIRKGQSKARPDLNNIISKTKELIDQKKINLIWESRNDNLAGQYNEFVLKV